ncbi:MAG: TSUP family transporter [Atopobiaceae bacterium]|nr:TSUP family transporter [Atopobiaceae bacterium]
MEYVWYVIAALGAGIGTGLAGLSAATVMVPILIVLCPSFAGPTGAYQATAIALASDILGSAVTTATYIRHGNIDLRRGWVMLACILCMCAVGSYAAFLVGNVVLGGFTLLLTFCIGIRFLVKPDTSRKSGASRGEKLDARGVAISLFFGLTIGFGTGFVGTGGGMMMLVVFTAFLGMELKTAVGTSTFIMTFTALIASASHVLIHPAILWEKWQALMVCVLVATTSSLVAARFANRASARTIGLVTGVVLTVLGATMIVLNYWELIVRALPFDLGGLRAVGGLAADVVQTFCKYLIYIGSLASALIGMYCLFRIPKNVFRKLLHVAAFTSSIFVVLNGTGWVAEALTLALFAAIVWPILSLAERWDGYGRLFVEKQPGEVKSSLLILFLSQATLVAFACGVLGKPYVVIASTAAWGLGDIAAAWVGRPLGKHKVRLRFADKSKSWEGTSAMAVVSFAACLVSLLFCSGYGVVGAVAVSLVVALASSLTELCSKNGIDTVTVPVVNSLVLWILSLVI